MNLSPSRQPDPAAHALAEATEWRFIERNSKCLGSAPECSNTAVIDIGQRPNPAARP
jgi:hypothetical protein